MSAEINDSMSFEEMLNASEEKRVHAGSIVKGIVTSISANEIQVDIGAKQTGFVKLSELTDDSSAKVEDLVKVGDELDLIVREGYGPGRRYPALPQEARISQGHGRDRQGC